MTLLVERPHVEPAELRGDLFPRHYTGITTYKLSHPVDTPSRDVKVDASWDWRLPDEYVEVSQ